MARTSDRRAAVLERVRVEAGVALDDLVLNLRAGAALHVRFEGEETHGHYRVMRDGVIVGADGLERGTVSTLVVPPGDPRLICSGSAPPSGRVHEFSLAAGEEHEIVIGE